MSKTLAQRQQEVIDELREQVAKLQSLLAFAAGGSKNSISENVQLRLENEELRKRVAFFWSVVPSEVMQEHPKLLSPHSGERTAEFSDWKTGIAVGCTIFIRHGQADVTCLGIDGCLYPGDIDKFTRIIPRQIAMLLNGIPTPADLRGTLPPGIEGEKLGEILRSLNYAWAQSEQRYNERRKELFDECWPDIERAYDKGNPNKVKDKEATRRDFYQFCNRNVDHWEKFMKENARVYQRWDRDNGPLKI